MARTKYTLIIRPEYHPTAVSAKVLADMVARGIDITSQQPITMTAIKRDRVHIYLDEDYARHVYIDELREAYHGKTFTAIVIWFNQSSGAGMVRIGDDSFTLYACNIEGRKTWYPETASVYYEAGQEIDVRLEVIGSTIFVDGLTPGHHDHEKWDRIKELNLAFRRDDTGKATNGLFA